MLFILLHTYQLLNEVNFNVGSSMYRIKQVFNILSFLFSFKIN